MKKFFTLIAAVAMAASVNAQVFVFDTPWAAGSAPTSITVNGLELTITDTGNKTSVDENTAYFGTADSYTKFTTRFKTGGKSGAKNALKLTLPSAGTLKVYARTGNNSATDRNIVLTQNSTELANKILLESEAVSVEMSSDAGPVSKNVYPVISVPVQKGDVEITYPTNSINIYGFELVSGTDGISSVSASEAKAEGATFNLLGQKVANNAKGIVVKNGKKFINK